MLREARADDLERALDMADAKRRRVAAYQPIFHRPAVDAGAVQAPWFHTMIERSGIVTLVNEGEDGVDGFVAAVPLPDTPLAFSVDDFVVARPDLWASVGRELLDEARREVVLRGATSWEVNCQPRDESKRRMLVDAGLVVVRLNMVNHDPLAATFGRLSAPIVAVRNAREGDIDGAVGLIMGQLARYHRLDPTFYRHPPDWDTERERLRAVLHEEGSICLAAGEEGTVRALLLANEIPRIPVYDPGGPVYFIQSLVARDGSWDTDGRALAVEAMRMMVERRAAMMGGFALSGDPERTALLEAVGLSVVTEFFREELIARVPD